MQSTFPPSFLDTALATTQSSQNPPVRLLEIRELGDRMKVGYSTPESTEAEPSVHLQIPGPRDVAKGCSKWHCSQVANRALERESKEACDLTLANGLDLELV